MEENEDFRILRKDFLEYFAKLQSNKSISLDEEFKLLDTVTMEMEKYHGFTYKDGSQKHNISKNRYASILPYDHSRVRIAGRTSPDDYINANYIPFVDGGKKNEFIATQGPLPNTVDDFWRMVLDDNVYYIVMLTRTSDGNSEKCTQYWPVQVGNTDYFGPDKDIAVTLTESEETECLYRRVLVLEHKISKVSRQIIQLQMYTWNDFSVPSIGHMNYLLTNIIQLENMEEHYPFLVHCSAGVGRTGTFMSIYRIVRELMTGQQYINVYDTVLRFRQSRPSLVETELQYSFIYEFIGDFLKNK